MKKIVYSALVAVIVLAAGCHSQKAIIDTAKLQTRISIANLPTSKEDVKLTFTVVNHSNQTQRFCKWETPFEPKLGKYFEILDSKGTEASFKGAMARRVMPPPAEAYIQVPAHDSVSTIINLANNYIFTTGKYNLTYVGGGVSGLEAGNKVKFSIAGK